MIETVYAVADAQVELAGGGQATVKKGEHWAATDPVVLAHRGLFTTDPRYGMRYSVEPSGYNDPPVEQATAAPGERRNVRRG